MSQRIVLPFLAVLCIAGVFSACQNVPKYKRTNGKFDEWGTYEGKNFKPSVGNVTAIDLKANTITISHGSGTGHVFAITPQTRIMHEGTDITLAQLSLNQSVRYSLSEDQQRLLTVWYGHGVAQLHPGAHRKPQAPVGTEGTPGLQGLQGLPGTSGTQGTFSH